MCYPAIAVANTILDLAAKKGVSGMTPMKLQKLLFFCQSWYLKKHDKPLFPDEVFRWQYGPVVGDVYREFSGFGSSIITNYASNADGKISIIPKERKDIYDFISEILDAYGCYSAWQLSNMTHSVDTAWSIGSEPTISNEEMKRGKV